MTTVQQMHDEFVNAQPCTVEIWRPASSDGTVGTYTARLEPITSRVFGEVQLDRTQQSVQLIHQECVLIPQVVLNVGRDDRATVTFDNGLPSISFVVIRVDRFVDRTGLIVERRD